MKHSTTICLKQKQSVKDIILKLDDFLQEYWKSESYKVVINKAEIQDNNSCFNLSMDMPNENFDFFAFLYDTEYQFLRANDYMITPPKSEVFYFSITDDEIEISFYNSFTNDSRSRQFDKIVDTIKTNLENDLPLPRIKKLSDNTDALLYKHRSYVNKLGFSCYVTNESYHYISNNSIFIYWVDFEYLRDFIYQVLPKEGFDDTSWNYIEKKDWKTVSLHMKNHRTSDLRLDAFYKYLMELTEQELSRNNAFYICFWGNL